MYAKVESKFAEALKKNALVYTQPSEVRAKWNSSVDVVYTLAFALTKKTPKVDESQANSGKETQKPQSPWLPPDELLTIEKLQHHTIVLNKFALSKYHFLLVTNEFEKQTIPLSEEVISVSFQILRQANEESKRRHIGFFNCGPESGASVAHKHIQFMTLPEHFAPFPDTVPDSSYGICTSDKRMPFAHFISKLSREMSCEDITLRYSELLGRVLTTISKASGSETRPIISYNLVFTEDWIMATPRSNETVDGISINSLGTLGLFLVKSEEQLSDIQPKGFELIVKAGYPYEDVIEYQPDHTGFTHY